LERPFYPSKILAANLGDLFTQVKTALQLEATLPTEKKQPSNLERPFQRKKIRPPIWSDLFTRVKPPYNLLPLTFRLRLLYGTG
jgi:hypothetical protein